MRICNTLVEAREELIEGSWLIDLGGWNYLVTDDEALVRDLRGEEHIARCEREQCWDETRLRDEKVE